MPFKPPTKVRVINPHCTPGKHLVAKLCQLGYDVVLGILEAKPPFTYFYNVIFDNHLTTGPMFAVYETYIGWENGNSEGNYSISKENRVYNNLDPEWIGSDVFAEYAIYLWGLSRGGRWPFDTQRQLITKQHIRDWDLVSLI